MFVLRRSSIFSDWLRHLKDVEAKARIIVRLRQAEAGNFGDCRSLGEGVWEMRINVGKGYRVYYVRTGKVVYALLCGGSKKTQRQDIAKAMIMALAAKKEQP
jgi:putative addiction module killer protein